MNDPDRRRANYRWNVRDPQDSLTTMDNRQLAVLMDLRDELQKLNRLLHCRNFTAIPTTLRAIGRNTAKPRERRRAAHRKAVARARQRRAA